AHMLAAARARGDGVKRPSCIVVIVNALSRDAISAACFGTSPFVAAFSTLPLFDGLIKETFARLSLFDRDLRDSSVHQADREVEPAARAQAFEVAGGERGARAQGDDVDIVRDLLLRAGERFDRGRGLVPH